MQMGIIGLPVVGKTTLFNLLTSAGATTGPGFGQRVNVGVGKVADPRLEWLASIYQPRKVTPATIRFTDVPGFAPGEDEGAQLNEFFTGVRDADALLMVIRAFHSDAVAPALGAVDGAAEADALLTELLIADLDRVETLSERIRKQRMQDPELQRTAEVLSKCQAVLDEGRTLVHAALEPAEERLVRGYQLMTLKPAILAVNVDDTHLANGHVLRGDLRRFAQEQRMGYLEFAGAIEDEIAGLNPDERKVFMKEYGIEESGIDRLARKAYESLGLSSFFTVGEDEVRAWTIKTGSTARQAGGKIHSDIERGFIRAEVASYNDFRAVASMKELRDLGKLRLEGRDYIVQDGDIINFRFNV